ncbi:YbaN family protein [Niveibacterium sp. 24ML]|uniref:YbaN family protein n=1 Tax=Niveibacterium sp. 24ML TaxID=2985512 RepID=UPI002270BAF9|nr:YbaN family protein [Niveibacterium sp. 24ML]MCX9157415.1 YbaN family protein [Niveibacterium sp. 24ML]
MSSLKPTEARNGAHRILWIVLGTVCLLLAVLGALLPLLPATPFVIAAAACFARSSPRIHAKLLNNKTFGPMIRDWEARRCMPRKAKVVAIAMMSLMGGISIAFFVPPGWPKLAGAAFILIGCATVLRIRTCPAAAASDAPRS